MLCDGNRKEPRPLPAQLPLLQAFLASQPRGLLEILREGPAWRRLEDMVHLRALARRREGGGV